MPEIASISRCVLTGTSLALVRDRSVALAMKRLWICALSLVGRAAMVAIAVGLVIGPSSAEAIPAWSRKYQTSCSTCHAVFPKLNYFGKAFHPRR